MPDEALNTADFFKACELTGSDGRYRATLSKEWKAGLNTPFGGYIAALMLRAGLININDGKQPASLSCYFHRPAPFGEVNIEVNNLRQGRKTSVAHVSMTDVNAMKILADAHVQTVSGETGFEITSTPMPDVAGVTESTWIGEYEEFAFLKEGFSILSHMDFRFPKWEKFATAEEPLVYVWAKLPVSSLDNSPFMETAAQVLATDGLGTWPMFHYKGFTGIHHEYIFPTLNQKIHFIRPCISDEWILYESRIYEAHGGLFNTLIRAWNQAGELVCTNSVQGIFISVGKDWTKG